MGVCSLAPEYILNWPGNHIFGFLFSALMKRQTSSFVKKKETPKVSELLVLQMQVERK